MEEMRQPPIARIAADKKTPLQKGPKPRRYNGAFYLFNLFG